MMMMTMMMCVCDPWGAGHILDRINNCIEPSKRCLNHALFTRISARLSAHNALPFSTAGLHSRLQLQKSLSAQQLHTDVGPMLSVLRSNRFYSTDIDPCKVPLRSSHL